MVPGQCGLRGTEEADKTERFAADLGPIPLGSLFLNASLDFGNRAL